MGDSTCLLQIQQPFSYISGPAINASEQSNPMQALSQSVSFGRFMTETLAWEKWSSFSTHKRYVEEAQSYAQPGSVAQKKAFFEAHYKEISARKAAAAALAQAQAASDNAAEPKFDHFQVSELQAKVVPNSEADLALEANRSNSSQVVDNAVMEPIGVSSTVRPALKVAVSDKDRNLSDIEEAGRMELTGTPSLTELAK